MPRSWIASRYSVPVSMMSSVLTSSWSLPRPSLNPSDAFDVEAELAEKQCEFQYAQYTIPQADQRTGMCN